MKPYYEHAGSTIYHGDCREVLPELGAEFDLIVTSPPYNLGRRVDGTWEGPPSVGSKGERFAGGYGVYDDALPLADYQEFQCQVLGQMWDCLSPTGAMFYVHRPRLLNGIAQLPTGFRPDLPLRQVVIWKHGGGINFGPAHFLPVADWVLIYAKPQWKLRDRVDSQLGDVWEIPTRRGGSGHPCPYPVELPGRILTVTTPRQVLDPFMGTGSTLQAAQLHGVPAVGIEIDERWCELAARRLQQEVLL